MKLKRQSLRKLLLFNANSIKKLATLKLMDCLFNRFLKMRHILISATLAIAALTGCTNLSQLAKQAPAGDDYYALLSNEYLAYSAAEAEQYDWYDSEYFAKKGLRAASGINVQPENIADWDIPSKDHDKIASERRRLVALVNGPAREDFPSKVAHTQVLFDCWLEQVDEQFLIDKESVCESQFEREIADIESQILLAKPAIPSNGDDTNANLKAVESSHSIFFGFDLAKLSMRGEAVINEVADLVKKMSDYSIDIEGYTDTAGPSDYNLNLSQARADNVANTLIESGVNQSLINAKGYGESNLLVTTADDVSEQKNRRVEIKVNGKRAE